MRAAIPHAACKPAKPRGSPPNWRGNEPCAALGTDQALTPHWTPHCQQGAASAAAARCWSCCPSRYPCSPGCGLGRRRRCTRRGSRACGRTRARRRPPVSEVSHSVEAPLRGSRLHPHGVVRVVRHPLDVEGQRAGQLAGTAMPQRLLHRASMAFSQVVRRVAIVAAVIPASRIELHAHADMRFDRLASLTGITGAAEEHLADGEGPQSDAGNAGQFLLH